MGRSLDSQSIDRRSEVRETQCWLSQRPFDAGNCRTVNSQHFHPSTKVKGWENKGRYVFSVIIIPLLPPYVTNFTSENRGRDPG